MSKRTGNRGVYAGSFDPVTYGHLEIIFEAAKSMDKLFVVVGVNPAKSPLFSTEERMEMIRNDIATVVTPRMNRQKMGCNIEVTSHTGLTAVFMKANKAPFYIRGLRSGVEFDEELPALLIGSKEYRDFSPMFLCASPNSKLDKVSSSLVRTAAQFEAVGTKDFVTPATLEKLVARTAQRKLELKR